MTFKANIIPDVLPMQKQDSSYVLRISTLAVLSLSQLRIIHLAAPKSSQVNGTMRKYYV